MRTEGIPHLSIRRGEPHPLLCKGLRFRTAKMARKSAVSIKNEFAMGDLNAGKPVKRISLQQVSV